MKKLFLQFTFIFLAPYSVLSQELFPHVDPASNIPKGVVGIRIMNEGFNEVNQFRFAQVYRFMFGVTSKLQVTQSFNFSNHHKRTFSNDFIKNDGSIGYHTHGIQKGQKYPFAYFNFNAGIKYRFLSIDNTKSHFRMSANIDLAGGHGAHDETEPNLMGDNGGIGAGITATKLKNRFAISLNVGGILPQRHNEQLADSSIISLKYGKALNYSLSMGLLCLPFKYNSYKQTNVNVYVEFLGKTYEKGKIYRDSKEITIVDVPSLEKGNYLEIRPSLQFIFNSNLRVDFSVATPIIKRSYIHSYPVYFFTIQRYFYSK